jgi:ubiquinone/menaquinone biosynthesis C-methylase UbiE
LFGLSQGTVRHDFIQAKMECVEAHHAELVFLVGEKEAATILCQINDESFERVRVEERGVARYSRECEYSALYSTAMQRFLLQQLGYLSPQAVCVPEPRQVLDVSCCSGAWTLEMARQHPQVQVLGIEHNAEMTRYAREQAQAQGVNNATFLTDRPLEMTEIAENTFDLVHARLVAEETPLADLARLLKQFSRVCCPGGTVLWVECDPPVSNAPAFVKWHQLMNQCLMLLGQTCHITSLMEILLCDAGLVNMQRETAIIDFSAETSAHAAMYCFTSLLSHTVKQVMIHLEVASREEIEQLRQHMLHEMLRSDFCAMLFVVSVWGVKEAE